MLIPNQTMQLLTELTRRTEAAQVNWTTGEDATEFVLHLPSGSIILTSSDRDGAPPIDLTITNSEGTIADRFTEMNNAEQAGTVWQLYNVARRSAAGSIKVVTDLLNDLTAGDSPF